ncbi:MAG: endonuclease/exonuclease/phosphatase family protein [Rhizobacter sp.]|nr:endonuclease/exonuclease/phosphatase family protein [Ferruginibacter sp.]
MAHPVRRFTKKFFIICNIIAGLLFLLGSYGYLFNPQKFWPIGLLTLGNFYFLLLLTGFIFFWLIAKPAYSLLPIITILLAWVPLKHLFKIRLSQSFEIKKADNTLRVMSWNVEHFKIAEYKKHPEEKMQMIGLINNYNPDVACFQEMVASDKNPQAINNIEGFMKELKMPYYYYSYNTKIDYDSDHRFGIIILSKFPLVNKMTVSYSPNDYNSIFQYADVVKGPDTFRLYNIHLQSMKFSDNDRRYLQDPEIDDENNFKESKSILSKLKQGFLKRQLQSDRIKKEMNQSPYPVIVCGDFNDVPNSYAYKTIGKGLKNAFAEKGAGMGRTYSHMSPTLRIDNIFTDERFLIEQYVRLNRKISDHYPVIADLYYNKP